MTENRETTDTKDTRWAALTVLCAGMLMIVLDVTVVNVALPTIQDDLGFSQSGLAWVVNAYMIAFAGLLLLSGRIGDLAGRRSVFLAGLAVFTGASVLCGLAQSQEWLIAARFVQGAGGAMASAVILGMIVTMFPEPREQARAIGVFAFVASAGGAVGLLLGGVLTEAVNWHWIFFVNVPIGALTAVLALRLVERDAGLGLKAGADVPGAVLVTAALMALVYTIVSPAAEDGWGATSTILWGAGGLLLLAAFLVRQATAATPLMPLRVFSIRTLAGANLIQALLVVGMFGTFFLGALYLERVLGYSPLEIGLAFLPDCLVMAVLSIRYTEPLITRFGGRSVLLAGTAALVAGLVFFAFSPVDASYWVHVFPMTVLLGLGAGLAFPALMTVAMADVEPQDAGLASGLVNTSAQVGGALGLAVLATVAASHTSGLQADGEAVASALNSGFHVAYLVGAGLALVAGVIAVLTLPGKADAPDAAAAHGHSPAEPATVTA